MLTKLPTELLHIVLGHLRFRDLETLLNIGGIAHVVRHCLVRRFRFQYQASSLLRQFEGMPSDTRKDQETRHSLANQLLELICQSVEKCARQDQRAKFTELLSSLEKWVVRRVLSGELPTGMELDYADLCLDIRYMYLHRPAVRVLHDAVSPNECQVTLCIHAVVIEIQEKKYKVSTCTISTSRIHIHLASTMQSRCTNVGQIQQCSISE